VAHSCNPSCLEGGDQEDHGLMLAQAKKKKMTPILSEKMTKEKELEVCLKL
jgi:hypothetical protein